MLFQRDKAEIISRCLELAILLEVSADKPGNVNFVVGFEGTNHAHFLASAVAASPHFRVAAEKGINVSCGKIALDDVGLGRIIMDCVADVNAWQSGGNTLLGTVILFVPLAVAAGITPLDKACVFELSEIRKNLKFVVEASTPEDAVAVYEAIKIANPSGLGRAPDFDVNSPDSINRILKEKVSLYNIFRIASNYDMICSEWVNNYPVTFDFAYPNLMEEIKRSGGSLNKAIVHTFLKVLAKYPDTFIARKVGIEKAREVSFMAEEILKLGGLNTSVGKEKLQEFDSILRKSDSLLNPGTTADIIAAALALSLLNGYRP